MVVFNRLGVVALATLAACAAWAADEMSLAECREKAAAGDAEAQYQLGQRYDKGKGVAKNGVRAVVQYKKAAEQKHAKACMRLAELYSRGEYLRKDAALAAKYRAWAAGESGEAAIAQMAGDVQGGQNVDEIEIALDYILGRNGKQKDPKAGIRILYDAAKSNPTAKVVFVRRWEKGDLDSALEVLTEKEWALIESWFSEAFAAGWKKSGLILGNREYSNRRYSDAANYYLAAGRAGLPKAWYYLGCLYWTGSNTNRWDTPTYMRSDKKACAAFKQAVILDPHLDRAKWSLGLLYLFSKDKKCADFNQAFAIFSDIYAQERTKGKVSEWTLFDYGLSGLLSVGDSISRVRTEYERVENIAPHRGRIDYEFIMRKRRKKLAALKDEYDSLVNKRKHCLDCIKRSAEMGCESARDFMESYSSGR